MMMMDPSTPTLAEDGVSIASPPNELLMDVDVDKRLSAPLFSDLECEKGQAMMEQDNHRIGVKRQRNKAVASVQSDSLPSLMLKGWSDPPKTKTAALKKKVQVNVLADDDMIVDDSSDRPRKRRRRIRGTENFSFALGSMERGIDFSQVYNNNN